MDNNIKPNGVKRACVIGGSSFVASMLIKLLLEKGYSVNSTVRNPNPEDETKVSHLLELQNMENLKLFQADLTDEASLEHPIAGCNVVFLVASPINFASQDPENDMIKPAVNGVINVLKACMKASTTVKRVIFTSSAAAVTINQMENYDDITPLIMNEENWSDVEFLTLEKPPAWGYPVSKLLAEKAAWKFAKENNIDLVSIIPSLIVGPSLTNHIPSSVELAMCFITGNELLLNNLKGMQMLSGSISMTHVEDVCEAHIFLAEKESASGRYICCAVNTCVIQLANFLLQRYPAFKIPTDFGGFPERAKLILSSDKLLNEGFRFKFGIENMYDQTIDFFKAKGLLKN